MPKSNTWRRLDNSAKIFPIASSKKYSSVFRLSAVLKEKINPKILRQSVEIVLKNLSSFKVKLKKGMFWYYFEQTEIIKKYFAVFESRCGVYVGILAVYLHFALFRIYIHQSEYAVKTDVYRGVFSAAVRICVHADVNGQQAEKEQRSYAVNYKIFHKNIIRNAAGFMRPNCIL